MNRKQRRALGLGKDSPLQGVLEGLQKVRPGLTAKAVPFVPGPQGGQAAPAKKD